MSQIDALPDSSIGTVIVVVSIWFIIRLQLNISIVSLSWCEISYPNWKLWLFTIPILTTIYHRINSCLNLEARLNFDFLLYFTLLQICSHRGW